MSEATINLRPWCARDKPYFTEPFVQDGYRYATDGYAIIRVPATGEPDNSLHRPNCGSFWINAPKRFRPLPHKFTAHMTSEGFVIECGGARFDPRFITAVWKLPEARYAVSDDKLFIEFDGGEAIVMSLKEDPK